VVTVITPGTSVDIKASGQDAITIETGGNATLTITEANTGNVALTSPYVKLNPGNITLDKTHYYVSGDTSNAGVLDVGETWTFSINTGTLTGNTTIRCRPRHRRAGQ